MANQRIAGLIQVQANGSIFDAKGAFDYNLGLPKREAVIGSDGVHGFKETPQVAFIEGAITDRGTLDVKSIATAQDQTITIKLGNGKTVVLRAAWYAGEGTLNSEESEFKVRWEGKSAQEIT